MSSTSFLDAYEPLDVIGNGSFGIIRKVRRKSDGVTFARKELNFDRMSERDRKQIVAEVNILKDLHHDHIVRYHDRYVDRDAGILYILMEYCGGGDLSTIIKQATKQKRLIPEDTIWNYFYQILQALQHCHHPNTHQRSGSGSISNSPPGDCEGISRRAQILHRDLKPDNVFLDENNTVKLGDFGLSKALSQASFANTYVGTPYYMSPELTQEKAYDSKSDIWSLGCLIYELCALKPPFHEAKTQSELSIFIRNGRIPPLPRGYSQSLTSAIKSMLNLNPAMRPSATQLLQHERVETIHKVAEAAKMFDIVKSHRNAVANREQDVTIREQALLEKEQRLASLLHEKDQEVVNLKKMVEQLQQLQHFSRHDVEIAVKRAVGQREDELRVLVMKREEEVAASIAKREEEIMEAVRRREEEVCEAWFKREQEIRTELAENCRSVQERAEWVSQREVELKDEEARLEEMREELEADIQKAEQIIMKGRKNKNPLEEVKNVFHSDSRFTKPGQPQRRRKADAQPTPTQLPTPIRIMALETPITRPTYTDLIPSAMKGVVLTSTGETLSTPAPSALAKLFDASPKVGLNFAKIFDFDENEKRAEKHPEAAADHSPPPSPSSRKEREKEKAKERDKDKDDASESTGSTNSSTPTISTTQLGPQPTRIRRPSIRSLTRADTNGRSTTLPTSVSEPGISSSASSSSLTSHGHRPKPLPHPHLRPSTSNSNLTSLTRAAAVLPIPVPKDHPSPEYDFSDEENLPSPFLKKIDNRGLIKPAVVAGTSSSAATVKLKRNSGLLLRAVAAANNLGRRTAASHAEHPVPVPIVATPRTSDSARPSLTSARKAGEEARKALSRP